VRPFPSITSFVSRAFPHVFDVAPRAVPPRTSALEANLGRFADKCPAARAIAIRPGMTHSERRSRAVRGSTRPSTRVPHSEGHPVIRGARLAPLRASTVGPLDPLAA